MPPTILIKIAEKKVKRLSRKQDRTNKAYNAAFRRLRSLYQQSARKKIEQLGDSAIIEANMTAASAWEDVFEEEE